MYGILFSYVYLYFVFFRKAYFSGGYTSQYVAESYIILSIYIFLNIQEIFKKYSLHLLICSFFLVNLLVAGFILKFSVNYYGQSVGKMWNKSIIVLSTTLTSTCIIHYLQFCTKIVKWIVLYPRIVLLPDTLNYDCLYPYSSVITGTLLEFYAKKKWKKKRKIYAKLRVIKYA